MHEARHTFASLLIDSGANAKAVQEFMGHSKIQTTFDTDGHLLPGSHDEVRQRMEFLLASTGRDFRLARAVCEKRERPVGDGALSGTTGRRDMCCLWEVGLGYRTPRGALNRVEAVSANWATPTPTRKTVAATSPVPSPMARPRSTAAIASM